ncbi:MAG: Cupin domain protein [Akkermansiaceae bacterium]|nr:Cupin domain protein [Akkermansiaceae bacterium]
MKIARESDIDWVEVRSPGGRFQVFRRHLSEALGAPRDADVAQGGHPFEVELARIPPGLSNCPYHAHAAQWEFFVILSGTGEVRADEAVTPVGAGDSFIFPPGEAHQLRNTGSVDLVYYVIADNPPADVITYPDSNKWSVKPQRKSFVMQEVDYYAGEE